MSPRRLHLLPLAAAALVSGFSAASDPVDHAAGIEKFRAERLERLTSDTGWLTVAGFAWLEPGENAFGSDPSLPVALPDGPERVGVLVYDPGSEEATVVLRAAEGAGLTVDDEPVTERVLVPAPGEEAPVVKLGRVSFWIIPRGDGHAVRVRDPESKMRREFAGIEFYPVDAAYRVEGRVVEPGATREIEVPNIMGYTTMEPSPGPVRFTLGEETVELTPTVESGESTTLFFVFSDATSGYETYGGGRFLYADLEENGTVVLDFNRAYNPPCAFTPFATCPLPPEGNDLPVAVRAGEKFAPTTDH